MNDKERISRLVGAAIEECSSSKLDGVRGLLVRAARTLGEIRDENRKPEPPQNNSFAGMSRDQVGSALKAIEDMIEREKSKSADREDGVDLFG
jgi:hypothetical protein